MPELPIHRLSWTHKEEWRRHAIYELIDMLYFLQYGKGFETLETFTARMENATADFKRLYHGQPAHDQQTPF